MVAAALLTATPTAAWASPSPLSPPSAPTPGPLAQQPPTAARDLDAHTAARLAPLQRAPPLGPASYRQPQEIALTADTHWVNQVLGVGVLNVLGFLAVQQVLRAFLDTSSPVTMVKVRLALRADGGGLRKRLREMGQLTGAGQEGLWLTLEETVNEITKRQGNVAYAEASASFFKSQNAALDAFKRLAAEEADRSNAEEEQQVVKAGEGGECSVEWDKPKPSALMSVFEKPLQSLFGGGGDDKCQDMVVVTIVVTTRGALDVPAVTNWSTLRRALQQVCGIPRSSLMALELLWSPNESEDNLSAEAVWNDYPDLIDLSNGQRVGNLIPSEQAAKVA